MSEPPEGRAAAMVAEFHYRIDWPARGAFPGHHRSRRGESGLEFRGHAPLLSVPDPRRLDLRASLRDPFGDWVVRVFNQRKAIPVVLVADLSNSVRGGGAARRTDLLADFAESLAWSAYRTGDAFGCVACADTVIADLTLAPTRTRGAGDGIAARLRALPDRPGTGATALREATRLAGRERALVFLASDFHLPADLVEDTLDALARHAVVPVVLRDACDTAPAPGFGFCRLTDAESGHARTLWLGPALRRRWATAADAREAALAALFAARGLRPLRLSAPFDASAVSAHFLG